MNQGSSDDSEPSKHGDDTAAGWHPMYERIGPFYDSNGVAYRLGVDEDALAARREERTLLAMRTGSGEWLYPAWQFTVEGPVHEQLVPVLAALRALDGWLVGVWIVNEHPDLGGLSPREALARGTGAATVARLAQQDAAVLNA